jgi:KEOPS complex subunit Cgi121
MLKLDNVHIIIASIKKLMITDTDRFISNLREIHKRVAIQAVNANFVAGKEHVHSILQQSLQARIRGMMLSERIEIDVLLRLACTNQIGRALNDIGIKQGINDVLIIAIGKYAYLKVVQKYLVKNYRLSNILKLSQKKTRLLSSHHKISREELSACISGGKLASILAERANLLW